MQKVYKSLAFILICEMVGITGSVVTIPAIYLWYPTLKLPVFTPPRWVFAPVWITLFLMMGVAAYLVWEEGIGKKKVRQAIIVFAVQLGLNFFWPFLFFGMHLLLLSFLEIILLWFAILATIIKFRKISRTTIYLLLPYILWVTFAVVLNYAIFILNP